MAFNNDKYRQFHQALILSPEYLGIENKDRKACKEFVDLATRLDKKSPPDPEDIEAAYVAAIDEARRLVTKGLLTVELPNEEQKNAGKTNTEANTTPASLQKYEIHPTAAIFPMMSDEALDELAADIKEHGLRDPVVTHDGTVIDGRNRLEACHRAGVEPTFTEWTGSGSVVTWILSVNLHRRHLTNQQRAMIAGKVAQELAAEAKSRGAQNLRKSGDPVEGLNSGPSGEGKSAARAAKLLNVSRDATNKAARIAKSGSDELVQAVTDGKVSLDAAAQVASLPKKKQRDLVNKGQVQKEAKKIRKNKAATKVKAKQVGGADSAPESVPVTTSEEGPTGTPPEPGAMPVAEPMSIEVDESLAALLADTEASRLLQEAHDALNDVAASGIAAGQTKKIENFLRNLIMFIEEYKAKLG